MPELSPIELKYVELNAHARSILATGKPASEMDDMFYRQGVELASKSLLAELDGEVVKYALDQTHLNPEPGLSPELATFHLASITYEVEQLEIHKPQ